MIFLVLVTNQTGLVSKVNLERILDHVIFPIHSFIFIRKDKKGDTLSRSAD